MTGPNGSGKSNLYRALRLLAETAQGRVIPSLAREGGLIHAVGRPKTISRPMLRGEHPVQGTPRKRVVSLRLGFAGDEFGYAIDLGLPLLRAPAFAHDPEIKRECIWNGSCCDRPRCWSIARSSRASRAATKANGRSSRNNSRRSTA